MKLFFYNKKYKNLQAFTLLEVLASLTIVTMVILGPLTSAIDSSSYARQTKDVMISTYLAEEALELLRHQYTTIYLQCIHKEGMCTDILEPNLTGETDSDKAWRIFKQRLDNYGVGVSCFDGCTFDFFDMKNATTTGAPPIYSPTGTDCSTLSLVTAVGPGATTKNYYVCTGVPAHHTGGFMSKKTQYSRNVSIESVPTFETTPLPVDGDPNLGLYNDDLIMTSSVSYRRSNGTLRTIKVIDFLHKRS